MTYNQCSFIKRHYLTKDLRQYVDFYYTAYIPTKYAIEGKVLKIKIDDVWEDGWIVISVGPKVDKKALPNTHAEVKAHRKRTGDSMRKSQLTE